MENNTLVHWVLFLGLGYLIYKEITDESSWEQTRTDYRVDRLESNVDALLDRAGLDWED